MQFQVSSLKSQRKDTYPRFRNDARISSLNSARALPLKPCFFSPASSLRSHPGWAMQIASEVREMPFRSQSFVFPPGFMFGTPTTRDWEREQENPFNYAGCVLIVIHKHTCGERRRPGDLFTFVYIQMSERLFQSRSSWHPFLRVYHFTHLKRAVNKWLSGC